MISKTKEYHCLTGSEALAYCKGRGLHISYKELIVLFKENKNIFKYSSKVGKNGVVVVQEELDEYFRHKEYVNGSQQRNN